MATTSIQQFPNLPARIADENGMLTDSYRYFLRALWERTGGANGATSILLDQIGRVPGDTLFRNTTEWTTLPIGTNGQVYRITSGIPSWVDFSALLDSISSTPGVVLYRGATVWQALLPGPVGYAIKSTGTAVAYGPVVSSVPSALLADDIEYVIDNDGAPLTTGTKVYLSVANDCNIIRATLLADQVGSIVVDIWQTSFANFDAGATHPVVGDSITGGNPLTIVADTKVQDVTLTNWSLFLQQTNVIAFHINSTDAAITRLTVALSVVKN